MSCQGSKDGNNDRPIVTVDGITLTSEELKNALPPNLSPSDSLALAEDYIGRWVRDKLMLRQAELNLSANEKNVERLLEEYRRSLLVHLYQQKMLEQNHAPMVTNSEIADYYYEMLDNFRLQGSIFKGVFLKVPKNAPNQDQLRNWIHSLDQRDIVNLESYAFQNAREYKQFFDSWIYFSHINSLLPDPIRDEINFLNRFDAHEAQDSLYNYFVAVHDYRLTGTTAPLAFVEERVRAIILNRKRIEFLQQLSRDLYEEGLRENIVRFY